MSSAREHIPTDLMLRVGLRVRVIAYTQCAMICIIDAKGFHSYISVHSLSHFGPSVG